MPATVFEPSNHARANEFAAAYTLVATDRAPLSGEVLLDMGQHRPFVDAIPQVRPMVIAQFFGLRVEGDLLGYPRVLVRFQPGDHGHGPAAVCLGEPGRFHVELGFPLDTAEPKRRELVIDTVVAITGVYLTDERAARYRHHRAHERRSRIALELEAVDALRQHTYQRLQHARAEADASWTLLRSVRGPH